MKLLTLALLAITLLSARGADIVILTSEDPNNYDAVNSMRSFAEKELRPLGHDVTLLEGNQAEPTDMPGLVEAAKDADLLVVFVRRATLPQKQLDAIRAHIDAGKPLVGIRTANHGFASRKPVPEGLATWPEFTTEVLGGQNTGYGTKGLPYNVSVIPEAAGSPLLEGVDAEKLRGHISLYLVLPLAENATPLLLGTPQGQGEVPPQPLAWTRTYGDNDARIFYTSLAAPEDMQQPGARRLLLNGMLWALEE